MQEQHPPSINNRRNTMTHGVGDRLLTAGEAALFLGLKIATIRRMTYAGELPVVRPTGRRGVRFRYSDLNLLLRMRSQPMRSTATK